MSAPCGKGRSLVAIDNLLDSIGLYRKNVAYDETCLFRAISEQLFDCQIHHERVRRECVDYARVNYQQFKHLIRDEQEWHQHLDLLEKHMAICGNIEIQIISRKYKRDILIYDANQQILINVTKHDFDGTLMLCLMNEDHYDVIHKREHIQNAGFCQSIVYGLLYEEVFKIPDVANVVHAMLYDKDFISSSSAEINNNNNEEQKQTNVAPFPFKVAKALDPMIYRNIEFDSWAEVRKQMRLGDWYYGDNNLILGTRCLFNDNNDEIYECYIQEMIKDQNRCVIYLTKFGEKRTVNYTDLSPEDDAKPWPLPYRFTKNLVVSNKNQTLEKSPKNSKKRKDKRLNKTIIAITTASAATTTTITTATTTTTATATTKSNPSDINAYIGAPLQIQNNLENYSPELQKDEDPSLSQHNLLITPEVASPLQKFTFESSPWTQPAESVIWSQTNQNVKPMVASVPTTPIILPYYDNSYPFVYNYGVNNYNSWSGQTDYQPEATDTTINNSTQDRDISVETIQPTTYPNYNETYEQSPEQAVNERPTLCTVIPPNDQQQQQQQVEVYSPVIQIPPGTPVIYAHPTPEMNEMYLPTPHVPIYTPPIQYVQPNTPYVYPNTPPTWYSPIIHPQHGFVFPTPTYNQNITQ